MACGEEGCRPVSCGALKRTRSLRACPPLGRSVLTRLERLTDGAWCDAAVPGALVEGLAMPVAMRCVSFAEARVSGTARRGLAIDTWARPTDSAREFRVHQRTLAQGVPARRSIDPPPMRLTSLKGATGTPWPPLRAMAHCSYRVAAREFRLKLQGSSWQEVRWIVRGATFSWRSLTSMATLQLRRA